MCVESGMFGRRIRYFSQQAVLFDNGVCCCVKKIIREQQINGFEMVALIISVEIFLSRLSRIGSFGKLLFD